MGAGTVVGLARGFAGAGHPDLYYWLRASRSPQSAKRGIRHAPGRAMRSLQLRDQQSAWVGEHGGAGWVLSVGAKEFESEF